MIPGKRVVLRTVNREDLPNYVQWLGDPVVIEYFGRYLPISVVEEEQWYETMLQDPTVLNFAIEFEGRHVGGAGFCNIDHRIGSAEAGIFIGVPELWDHGLGRDAMQVLVRLGFEQLNLNRISLRVFAENKRAVHLYESMGFQHEGTWRQAEFRKGRYQDILWMSILRAEWQGLEAQKPKMHHV